MARSITARLERLERARQATGAGPSTWFDLGTWRAETAAGVDLAEQERRRLAEYPHLASEIRAVFGRVRGRVAGVAALQDVDTRMRGGDEWAY